MSEQKTLAFWCSYHHEAYSAGSPAAPYTTCYRYPQDCIMIPLVEAPQPPEVGWASEDMTWMRPWVAMRPHESNPTVLWHRKMGTDDWFLFDRFACSYYYGIPVDQLPPHQPAWSYPHGVDIAQAREIAAELEKHESES